MQNIYVGIRIRVTLFESYGDHYTDSLNGELGKMPFVVTLYAFRWAYYSDVQSCHLLRKGKNVILSCTLIC